MISLLLALQLQFGPTYGPWWEFPAYEGRRENIVLVKVRWDYRKRAWDPPVTKGQREWLDKYQHILVDWRWDLETNTWVRRRPKSRRMCLT